MSLFQNSVLNKYLKGLESEKVNEEYKRFTSHFHNTTIQENIRNSNEEQYQGEFLIDLFVNVLGYTKNPTPEFNLTTELKNIKGSKKTDGAILKVGKALAVIELKGTNTTDLSKVETQAFGYKNNQPGCNYVITSNFEKLRFYIDNAVDFEEFNLFQLSKERFDILWLCLSSEYLLKDIPKKIKDESLTQEENVTKKLYKDYALFRNEIFDAIQKENPEYDKLTLFKKTQKLLDRFLFIFFAEDRLLLPPNSIRSIVNQWTDLRDKYDEYFPLYDRFKKYFGYMNTGHKGQQHDIFAYNGGLFAPDEILDNIKINDDLLHKHTINLSNYDFESEVSVNILGHIFEHSLNDIDEIQAEIQGVATEQNKTKRKKDGVFYTPKYITKYIVDNTVGKLCEEKKTELDIQEAEYEKERKGRQKATLKKLSQKLEEYRKWLLQITICDPACGSGAFLNQTLEFLIAEHQYVDELQAKLFGDAMVLSEVENSILENNIYGVDINDESVEIAKLSLWLRTAQKGRKLTSLNNNIKCGNSLIDDPTVAGDKAFNWQNEFPEVFSKGGFDVIVGNPPYVGQKGNKEIFEPFKTGKWSKYYERKQDLYYYFLIQSTLIASSSAEIGMIVPQYWLTALGASNIREFLTQELTLDSVLDVSKDNVFPDAGVNSMVFNFSKPKSSKQIIICEFVNDNLTCFTSAITNDKLTRDSWHIFKSNSYVDLSLKDGVTPLGDICSITPGIQTGSDKVSNSHINKLNLSCEKGEGIFVLNDEELEALNLNSEEEKFIKPFYKNSDIGRYKYNKKNKDWLVITNSFDSISRYPNIERHLLKYKSILDNRFRNFALKKADEKGAWWYLYGYRPNTDFESKKIVFPYRGTHPKFVFTEKMFYASIDVYFITNLDSKFDYLELTAILNSKLIEYFILKNCKLKGSVIEFYTEPMSKIPIIKPRDNSLREKAAKLIMLLDEESQIQNRYNSLIRQHFGIDLSKSNKLNLLEMDFNRLIEHLTKNGISFSLKDSENLLEYYTETKSNFDSVNKEIKSTNRLIDQIVYELYGLKKEKINIVEEATA